MQKTWPQKAKQDSFQQTDWSVTPVMLFSYQRIHAHDVPSAQSKCRKWLWSICRLLIPTVHLPCTLKVILTLCSASPSSFGTCRVKKVSKLVPFCVKFPQMFYLQPSTFSSSAHGMSYKNIVFELDIHPIWNLFS